MYFKVFKLCMNFYLNHEIFFIYFKISYNFTICFYDTSLFCIFRVVLKLFLEFDFTNNMRLINATYNYAYTADE
jgi:hypothetical protein